MMAMPTPWARTPRQNFALEGASEIPLVRSQTLEYFCHFGCNPALSILHPFAMSIFPTAPKRPWETNCAAYSHVYQRMQPFIERLMLRSHVTPEQIAELTLATLDQARPPLRIPATLDAKIFYLLRRLLPRKLYHSLLYYSLPGIKEGAEEPAEHTPQNLKR